MQVDPRHHPCVDDASIVHLSQSFWHDVFARVLDFKQYPLVHRRMDWPGTFSQCPVTISTLSFVASCQATHLSHSCIPSQGPRVGVLVREFPSDLIGPHTCLLGQDIHVYVRAVTQSHCSLLFFPQFLLWKGHVMQSLFGQIIGESAVPPGQFEQTGMRRNLIFGASH